mmetsp:Transcript_35862/g.78575  ORF Transcript_35862/g.78575 Transcript_35862/m.78575 type:complete len:93 (-) Transcript_35862:43-321(-)
MKYLHWTVPSRFGTTRDRTASLLAQLRDLAIGSLLLVSSFPPTARCARQQSRFLFIERPGNVAWDVFKDIVTLFISTYEVFDVIRYYMHVDV